MFYTWIADANIASAELLVNEQFEDDGQRLLGFKAGTAASAKRVNTALRQSTLITVALMDALNLNTNSLDLTSTETDVTNALTGTNLFKLSSAFTVGSTATTFNKDLLPNTGKNIGSSTKKVNIGYFDNADIGSLTINNRLLLDWLHPVYSIFETTDSNLDTPAKVAAFFGGGTWEYFGKGKVLVAYDPDDNDFSTVGDTGGSKTSVASHSHTFTPEGEISYAGAHQHMSAPLLGVVNNRSVYLEKNYMSAAAGGDYFVPTASTGPSDIAYTDEVSNHKHAFAGSEGTTNSYGDTNGNLQPYIVIYRYRRTA